MATDLPDWICKALIGKLCEHCGIPLQAESFFGCGVELLEPEKDRLAGPIGFVIARCRVCYHVQRRLAVVQRDDMTVGVIAAFALVQAPREQRERDAGYDDVGICDPLEELTAEDFAPVPPVRPSVRRWTPLHPFSESEINIFLNKLRRASFKVGSKGLRRFLLRLGLKPDDFGPLPDEPEDPPF